MNSFRTSSSNTRGRTCRPLKGLLPVFFLLLLQALPSAAQEQEVLAKFYVTHATENKQDITEWASQNKIFTVFYAVDDELYMANVCDNSDDQSWGRIWGFESAKQEETDTEYETDIFYFNWTYTNSYDEQEGTCKVQFLKIYKPQGVVSKLRMITEALDMIEYTGYMEGSVDFSNF